MKLGKIRSFLDWEYHQKGPNKATGLIHNMLIPREFFSIPLILWREWGLCTVLSDEQRARGPLLALMPI